MMFGQELFAAAKVSHSLQRQNAWSEKDLTALLDKSYSKSRQ